AGGPPRPRAGCCARSATIGDKLSNIIAKTIDARNFLSFRLSLCILILIPAELEAITLVLPDLKILFGMPIQRHSDRERLGECLRIVHRRFVGQYIQRGSCKALSYPEAAAMEIARRIKPCAVGESGRFNHQSIPLPAPAGIPHPELRTVKYGTAIHFDEPERVCVLRSD